MNLELTYFWGSITGNNYPKPDNMYSKSIQNPAIHYFHKILAHTLFGKEANITSVWKDELFIMYCASQSIPTNAATFMLARMDWIAKATYEPIIIGG